MADIYPHEDAVDTAARQLVSVTPNDSTPLAKLPKALYVGGAGNLSIIAVDDSSAVTLSNVPAGSIIPVRARIVRATGTTATGIIALL